MSKKIGEGKFHWGLHAIDVPKSFSVILKLRGGETLEYYVNERGNIEIKRKEEST